MTCIAEASASTIFGGYVGAICNARRNYLRNKRRSDRLPETAVHKPDPDLERVSDMWPDQLAAREVLDLCTTRAQQAQRMRYLEGYSIPEMATLSSLNRLATIATRSPSALSSPSKERGISARDYMVR